MILLMVANHSVSSVADRYLAADWCNFTRGAYWYFFICPTRRVTSPSLRRWRRPASLTTACSILSNHSHAATCTFRNQHAALPFDVPGPPAVPRFSQELALEFREPDAMREHSLVRNHLALANTHLPTQPAASPAARRARLVAHQSLALTRQESRQWYPSPSQSP